MWGGENCFEGWKERLLGLLDAGLEEIGGLEEDGGCQARAEAGGEVEDCFGCFRMLLAKVAVFCRCHAYMSRCQSSPAPLLCHCSTWRWTPQGQPGMMAARGASDVIGGSIPDRTLMGVAVGVGMEVFRGSPHAGTNLRQLPH